MSVISVAGKEREFEFEPGESLLNILLSEGIFVDNPCAGKGVCGKCKVRILKGEAGEVTVTEKEFLSEEEIQSGVRLSCVVKPESDLTIQLMHKERKHKVLTSGYMPKFDFDLGITKEIVKIHKPSLEDQTPFDEQLTAQLGDVEIPLEVLQAQVFESGIYTAVICDGGNGRRELMSVEKGDTTSELYGIAIDIGTTTVVTSLIDLKTGEECANASMINAQKHYGLDVLTRITYELENPENGVEQLQYAIVNSINEMIAETCEEEGISRTSIYDIAIGANCTMMHMLLGVNAESIGKSPYAPMFARAQNLPAKSIGIQASEGARLYCLPSVSAYIGADIVAGAYVCELQHAEENVLFIDIGTNGEIVFSNHGKLMSCSCAAGPALEGMNISAGMRASEGAIEDVKITEDGIELKVIGDAEPAGICGSGILAVVKELVRAGFVRPEGAFVKLEKLAEDDYRRGMLQLNGKKREFILTESPQKLLITQSDIRQVQLAKGAILSGFYALLSKAGVTMDDLDKVMIAGQFGAHLPQDSLIGTGILPEGIRNKLEYVGNSSKTGAYMALMSRKVRTEMEELAQNMDYMELGATDGYERLFTDCLIFPEV